jgi:type I restriction-modification system DNA methylase subunit
MIKDIKQTLRATADKLRANMDAAEYKHIVLRLISVKCPTSAGRELAQDRQRGLGSSG